MCLLFTFINFKTRGSILSQSWFHWRKKFSRGEGSFRRFCSYFSFHCHILYRAIFCQSHCLQPLQVTVELVFESPPDQGAQGWPRNGEETISSIYDKLDLPPALSALNGVMRWVPHMREISHEEKELIWLESRLSQEASITPPDRRT